MGMDWKEALGQLRQDPDLPVGDADITDEPVKGECGNSPADVLHVVMEKKGRKGKTATIVEGFSCPDSDLEAIASRLKKKLGVGGSARGGEILIQGDYKDRVTELLRELGYKVK